MVEEAVLLQLYDYALQEEQYFHKAHQDRIAFYTGLLSAVATVGAAGLAAGARDGVLWPQLAAFSAVPLLLSGIAANAIEGTARYYRRLLEAMVTRAKLEQDLGITGPVSTELRDRRHYWPDEPIVGSRFLASRMSFETSEQFVERQMGGGYQAVTVRLFAWIKWLGLVAFIGLLLGALALAL